MKRAFFLVLALAAVCCARADAGQPGARRVQRGSRALSGWFNVTAENGWRGRRYMDGDRIFAEEFAAGPAGRIDVWRFYRGGVLTSEERDLNDDGRVDFQTRWDPRNGLVASVLRDTTMRGMNDLEIERTSHNRWEIREDRNLDGVTDRILFVQAPNDALDAPGADLAGRGDVAGLFPREGWREMWSDDGYTGSITDYFRYNHSGVLGYYGQWDGRRIEWERCAPDFVPPPAAPAQAPAVVRAAPAPFAPLPPADAEETIRDPFNMAAGAADEDPYAGLYPAPAPVAGFPEGTGGFVAPEPQAPRSAPETPGMFRLPTDESSARSVPARMRPPGTAARRRRAIF